MLLLYIFLLSCCLPGSMGSAVKEFQVNFQALVDLAKKEQALVGQTNKKIFLPVPAKKFQCNLVPCHLERTVEKLKFHSKNEEMRAQVSLMEKNMERIISTLNKAHTKPERDSSCPTVTIPLLNAVKHYERFFEKLEEMC